MRIVASLFLLSLAGPAWADAGKQDWGMIERGRYLTQMGDCLACHTAPGGAPFAGGRAIETPFGTILSANITPDPETGIGAWSDHDFLASLQKGRGRDGMHLYPAMPYTYTARITRGDGLAIRAYLETIPAIRHPVNRDTLPFPFSVRALMGIWNLLFFREGVFRPDPARPAEWNRGAYLVTGIEHCGMCHTPKNFLGGDEDSRALQGNVLQGWLAPNITHDTVRGIGAWSKADIATYLRSGHNRFADASGPMAEEIAISSSGETDADLGAIATYLESRPGQAAERPRPLAADQPPMRRGAAIYADLCSACHKPDGTGIPGMFPALAGNGAVQGEPASVVRVILRGAATVSTEAAPTGAGMPSFAWDLDDGEVASVVTYIRNAWGNAAPPVDAAAVGDERSSLARRAGD